MTERALPQPSNHWLVYRDGKGLRAKPTHSDIIFTLPQGYTTPTYNKPVKRRRWWLYLVFVALIVVWLRRG